MGWSTPKTWATNDPLNASNLNTYIRDQQVALKDPPTAKYRTNEGSDYTTTSTSFVDVDATNLALTITTTGGDVMIGFTGSVRIATANNSVYFDVVVDGTREAGDDGITKVNPDGGTANIDESVSFVWLARSLAAGSHTFKLQWKVSGSTATLHAGAGTVGSDTHATFWAREVS